MEIKRTPKRTPILLLYFKGYTMAINLKDYKTTKEQNIKVHKKDTSTSKTNKPKKRV